MSLIAMITALIAALVFAGFARRIFFSSPMQESTMGAAKTINLRGALLAGRFDRQIAQYRLLFGLDDDAEVDIERLIAMGQKLEERLGKKRMERIKKKISRQYARCLSIDDIDEIEEASAHFVNVLVSASKTIVNHFVSFYFTKKQLVGGDNDEDFGA